jgi:hypothetical protein
MAVKFMDFTPWLVLVSSPAMGSLQILLPVTVISLCGWLKKIPIMKKYFFENIYRSRMTPGQ